MAEAEKYTVDELADFFPISSYVKDGTLVLLLVDYSDDEGPTAGEHALEDSIIARTVGFNNLLNDGCDVWQFAGWCWEHDHFTEGRGRPIGWAPLPPLPGFAVPDELRLDGGDDNDEADDTFADETPS